MKTIIKNINSKNTNVILGKKNIVLYGDGYIYDKLGNYIFKISPLSFYQTNPIQTELLYNKAIEFANLSKEDVLCDLYCGIGTIGIFASKFVKKVFEKILQEKRVTPTAIIVDPPRKGLDNTTIKTILKLNVSKLVYISCNPATMLRDLKMLEEKYFVKKIQPVDMFPFTSHVECVAVLQIKKDM